MTGTAVLRMMRLARFVRIVRLFRLRHLRGVSKALVSKLTSQSASLGIEVLAHFIAVMFLNHFVACAWFAIAAYNTDETTWIRDGEFDRLTQMQCYVLALHWSLTQFAPSTQNIAPSNTLERTFACVVVLVGLLVFSSVVSSITGAINQLRVTNMRALSEERKIREFLTTRGISVELYGSIQAFFKHTYRKKHEWVCESDIPFFDQIPQTMLIQMHTDMYTVKLITSDGIRMLFSGYMPLMRQICHTAMSESSFLSGQDIFLQGADAWTAFHVSENHLVYDCSSSFTFNRRRSSARASARTPGFRTRVRENSWLTEMALWCEWKHRGTAWARATTSVTKLDCREVFAICANADRTIIKGVRIFAIFYVDHIERMEADGLLMQDLPLSEEQTAPVFMRSKRLARMATTALDMRMIGSA
uniref:Cyclic nucleotide-binding domain-containing protein n=1 Tax=Zooxanthella nutricula TaxID=1333877 RepID=A0A7S2VPQ6_9DINO